MREAEREADTERQGKKEKERDIQLGNLKMTRER